MRNGLKSSRTASTAHDMPANAGKLAAPRISRVQASAINVLRRVPASARPQRTFSRIFSAFCLWMASMSTRLFLYTLPFTCRAGAGYRQAQMVHTQMVSGRVSRAKASRLQQAVVVPHASCAAASVGWRRCHRHAITEPCPADKMPSWLLCWPSAAAVPPPMPQAAEWR